MSTELHTYRLCMTWTTAILFYGLPAGFVLLTVFILAASPEGLNKNPLMVLVWCLVVAGLSWEALRRPVRISILDDGTLEFCGVVGRRLVAAGQVKSIRPGGNREGMLVLRHTGGKIHFLSQFDGFHDFLNELEKLNPTVELKGC